LPNLLCREILAVAPQDITKFFWACAAPLAGLQKKMNGGKKLKMSCALIGFLIVEQGFQILKTLK
jgi:hypothetical protein